MKNTTRKHIWPVSLVMTFAIIGMLAAFVALATLPQVTDAQGPPNPFGQSEDQQGGNGGGQQGGPDNPFATPEPTGAMPDSASGDMITSSSTSASAGVKFTVDIASLPMAAVAGTSVVLYLEDDYKVPDTIDRDTVYFTVNNRSDSNVNGGGRVYVTDPIEISDDDHFGGDDDWDIQVFIPDMNDAEDSGYNGPAMGDNISLVFTKAAGIKNPSEAHDSNNNHAAGYKASYTVLGPNASVPDAPADNTVDDLIVKAKIGLSDEDNKRGYELVVTGSGFNNGTTAGVYVLNRAPVGDDDLAMCNDIVRNGSQVGDSEVGSDDKVTVTVEVTVPTFMAGTENYICMVDGEGRASFDDIEQFELEPSIRVVPTTVAAGDIVNVFAQDYPMPRASFNGILLSGQMVGHETANSIGADHSGSASFVVPGGFKGTLRVDATWTHRDDAGEAVNTKKNANITIAPSVLTLSKEEVSANESITLRGSGFGDGEGCLTSITMSGAELMLISDDGTPATVNGRDCIDVEVSSAGQFAATVAVWSDDGGNNPALTSGTHTIEVVDDEGFTATAMISVREPTLMVTPDVAGPRDYITISGENWPVENEDGARIEEVIIDIDSGADDEDADPDASGRWSITYRVAGDVVIPSTVPIKASYGPGSEIVKVDDFSVPQANLTVDPMRGVPGDTISLSATGLSLFESAIQVKIGSLVVNVPDGTHTDRDGAIESLEVLVPSLDPALYTVQLRVKDTVTIGELTVMDDRAVGVPVMLPDALMDVGDNLEAVFYFNDATKSWQVFDPRPEWADLNTLTDLVAGQAYWILVKETQEDVVLNGRLRSLTCSGDNCWNLEVW